MHRIETHALIGVLLCLGAWPAVAQDNPWRVPGTGGDYGYGLAAPGYSSRDSSADTWSGRSAAPYEARRWDSQGWDRQRGYDPPPPAPAPSLGGDPARRHGGTGSYAALPQSARSSLPGTRSMNDSSPYAADAYGSRWDPGQTARKPWEGNAPKAGFGGDAYAADPANRPPQPPPLRLGEFPPLEGEQRLPSEERLPPSSRRPPPPPPPPPYGAYPPPAYGQGYAYAPYAYRDPALAGPSTLNSGWSGYGGYAGLGYAPPYAGGVPGPYGW